MVSVIILIFIYSSSNYSNLDELTNYIDEYNKGEERNQFDNSYLALKIMPGYNTEKNVLFAKQQNDYKYSTLSNAHDLMQDFNMNATFYYIDKTQLFFPKLSFKKDNVPVGNSVEMCISVSITTKDHGKNFDLMQVVEGFDRCTETQSGKFIWNEYDPVNGVNVPVWKQYDYNVDCGDDEECDGICKDTYGAIYIKGKKGKKCYGYEILDSMCIVIDYDKYKNKYFYSGGCYDGGKTYRLNKAEVNTTYK